MYINAIFTMEVNVYMYITEVSQVNKYQLACL